MTVNHILYAKILPPALEIAGTFPIEKMGIKRVAMTWLPADSVILDDGFQQSRIVVLCVVSCTGASEKQ